MLKNPPERKAPEGAKNHISTMHGAAACWLAQHSRVEWVSYPGLKSHLEPKNAAISQAASAEGLPSGEGHR